MNILIPAAGLGSRFLNSKYNLPKPNIEVDGAPMLVTAAKKLGFRGNFIFILQENEHRDTLAQALKKEFPNCKIGVIDFITDGAAETASIAKDFIDSEEELVIANCDQIMEWGPWNSDLALKQLRRFDAGVVVINSNDPKHSYAQVENNFVTDIQEKSVISNNALTGIHYWKHGSDFISSATKMMLDNNKSQQEFYIGPTFNYLIAEGKKVGTYTIGADGIHFIGTPSDLENYENRKTV